MFLSRNKKNNAYPCKAQFYYIKVGFKRIKIIQACFCDVFRTYVSLFRRCAFFVSRSIGDPERQSFVTVAFTWFLHFYVLLNRTYNFFPYFLPYVIGVQARQEPLFKHVFSRKIQFIGHSHTVK